MIIAQAATRFNALRNTAGSPDICKCHGGQGHCTGCDSEPVIRRFQRVEGLNGENGHSGAPCAIERHSGVDGLPGNVTIVVHRSDGSQQEYSSLYCLELIDFDVEDENGDGIFEPGEHLFIRRITVRNSGMYYGVIMFALDTDKFLPLGGMPSPRRPIQLNMIESNWFKLIDGDEGRTVLPSIREGSSLTIDRSIKVRIREQEEYETPHTGAIFLQRDTIHLLATMPWIERRIPKFDFNKRIEIRYPCELRNIKALATVAQASLSKLSFEACTLRSLCS